MADGRPIIRPIIDVYTFEDDFPRQIPVLAFTSCLGILRESFGDKEIAVNLAVG